MNEESVMSAIDRENILNNSIAISAIQKQVTISGALFNGKHMFTVKQVADFFEVNTRTIERLVDQNREELANNGYKVFSGEELQQIKNNFGADINVGTKTTILALMNFRAFLNIGMLLTDSKKAKELRSLILNTVIDAINKKVGGNTKYINQRDENYIIAAYYNEGYNKTFIKSLRDYVDASNAKYPHYTDKIYKSIFGENTFEYKKILDLAKNDKARDTMYSEVLTAISSLEAGVADFIRQKSIELNKKLTKDEVDKLFDEIASMPTMRPMIEMARVKMASLDRGLRNVEHPTLADYVLPLDSSDFERFLGEKSKELSNRINENIEVFKRLKDK